MVEVDVRKEARERVYLELDVEVYVVALVGLVVDEGHDDFGFVDGIEVGAVELDLLRRDRHDGVGGYVFRRIDHVEGDVEVRIGDEDGEAQKIGSKVGGEDMGEDEVVVLHVAQNPEGEGTSAEDALSILGDVVASSEVGFCAFCVAQFKGFKSGIVVERVEEFKKELFARR